VFVLVRGWRGHCSRMARFRRAAQFSLTRVRHRRAMNIWTNHPLAASFTGGFYANPKITPREMIAPEGGHLLALERKDMRRGVTLARVLHQG
jgi:hypothetical protein